jgi:hypothetical protein
MKESTMWIIGFIVVIVIFCVGLVILLSGDEPEIPLTCGITQENKSESYTTTTYTLVGKIFVPTTVTHYRHDLVCTNGTTILGYQ